MKFLLTALLLAPTISQAAVDGKYSVSGLLSSPSIEQCYFELSIRTEASTVTLSEFSCGKLRFSGKAVKVEGALLRNNSGAIVGTVSDSVLQYQENGLTIRVSMRGADKAFLQYSVATYVLTGNLVRKP